MNILDVGREINGKCLQNIFDEKKDKLRVALDIGRAKLAIQDHKFSIDVYLIDVFETPEIRVAEYAKGKTKIIKENIIVPANKKYGDISKRIVLIDPVICPEHEQLADELKLPLFTAYGDFLDGEKGGLLKVLLDIKALGSVKAA